MIYTSFFDSPVGEILLASKNQKLIGVWIEGQKYYFNKIKEESIQKDDDPILMQMKQWLQMYFNGLNPKIPINDLAPIGTEFSNRVWKILCGIPYGKVTTYGKISDELEKIYGRKMSAQAVGSAVGHNPISIIIPCHRVIGKDGNLTGYAGGIDKKIKLLEIEKVDMSNMYIPK